QCRPVSRRTQSDDQERDQSDRDHQKHQAEEAVQLEVAGAVQHLQLQLGPQAGAALKYLKPGVPISSHIEQESDSNEAKPGDAGADEGDIEAIEARCGPHGLNIASA